MSTYAMATSETSERYTKALEARLFARCGELPWRGTMLRDASMYGLVLVTLTGCGSERVSGERFLVYDSSGVSIAWSEAPLVAEPVLIDAQPIWVVPPEFAAPEHV